ncbi:phage tail-collar fiber domain-containing protein [Acinetobacter baumannii]|uniref:phage tail-collar fiber domain-containing protein n=1 Tax=Acinetobacter baumannii TaxID=470 RepID=UPI0021532A6A|nr:phage tail protein [Acinetobacter baumannii]MCR6568711.1 phage tail protein [Acinetobacter baumannii]
MATYKGILTNNGKALIAGATVSNKINYSHIAVGDGNGSVPVPSETRTTLINEKARIALNVVEINPNNTNQIVCEAIIPSNVGGFFIRELGLYAGNTMVVNASYPPTYKPLADEGGAREINIKLVINIQNAEVIALYLDDSLIYATREWVNKNYIRRNEIVDNLATNDSTKPLSAKQGKNLQDNKLDKTANAVGIELKENRTLKPTQLSQAIQGFFGTLYSDNSTFYCDLITLNGWIDASGGRKNALVFNKTSQSLHHYQADYAGESWAYKKQIAYTDSDITGNAASATKLQNVRKINGVDFDGTQDINIEAPVRFNGTISNLQQLDQALLDGKYTVAEFNVAGLYGYGVLVVFRSGGMCHQVYYPHQAGGTNNATMAMRQDWNVNGNIASWSDWRIVGTQDDSKLPLVGGTVSGNLRVNGIVFSNKVYGDSDLWFTSENEQKGRRILTGGILASDTFSEANLIPNLGIYAKGAIHTKTGVYADKYFGYNGPATYTGYLDGKLTTPRLINGVAFDASTDINIPPVSFYIPAGADLNNYLKTGFYYQDTDAGAAQIANLPQTNAFELRVETSAGSSQWLSPYNGGGVVFYRHYYGGTWSAWIKIDPHNIDGNAASATKLQNVRKINGVDFDGTQDINIEAPVRFNGTISNLQQLDQALLDGKYTVAEFNVAGLYGYGVLVVFRSGGMCHQVYYPHQAGGTNNATMAMRQDWNVNGNIASWSDWRIVGTQDDSKLPLVGGTVSGNLRVNGIVFSNKVYGDSDLWFTSENEQKGRRILTGGILASDTFSEANLIPNLGIYAKGAIHTKTGVYADKYFGYNGPATYTGYLDGKLTTPRLINGVAFDASTDINIPPVSFYIPAGADLNNYLKTGFYYQDTDAGAAQIANLPQTNAFELRVETSAGSSQWLSPYNGGGVVFYRHYYGGTWSAWIKIDPHNIDGNAATATRLQTARNIALTGAVSGSANFDGSGNITIVTTANNAIGVGQSWSDVTSSRSSNTTYTNTTGKPIQIMVLTPSWNNAGSFDLLVDGVPVVSIGNQDGYNQSKPTSVLIPNGSTYRVNGNFQKWSELR